MTRIVCLSDTHGAYITPPSGEILIHAGDWCAHSTWPETKEFLNWFQSQPHPIKIFIAGNHDRISERHPENFANLRQKYAPDCMYLEDSACNAAGLSFWGSPVSPRFFDWAWNRDRGPDIRKHWDLIPNHVDVLITHGPPYGILDISHAYEPDKHLGCAALRETVHRTEPLLHVFGHIHGSGGKQEAYVGAAMHKTIYVNASIMDEAYCPSHQPVVIDLP